MGILDIDAIDEMDKDQIEVAAREHFGVELDKRRKIADLRDQIKQLAGADAPEDKEPEQVKVRPTHLKNQKTGLVFDYTDRLAALDSLVPCDKDGNRV